MELKPEHVKDYCDIHRNAWPKVLQSSKDAGSRELVICNYKNFSLCVLRV